MYAEISYTTFLYFVTSIGSRTVLRDAETEGFSVCKNSSLTLNFVFNPVMNSSAQDGARIFTFSKSREIVSPSLTSLKRYADAPRKAVEKIKAVMR